MADEAAEERAGVEGRDDDARGDFDAEGDDSQDEFGQRAVDEEADVVPTAIDAGLILADPAFGRSIIAAVD